MYHIQTGRGHYFKEWNGDEPRYTHNKAEAFTAFNRATCSNLILQIDAYCERAFIKLSHQIVEA